MEQKVKINRWLRWGYGFILGIMFKFILDIIFSLVYTYYNLFEPITTYLLSIAIVYLVVETLLLINRRLNTVYSWNHRPYARFFLQFILNAVVALVLVFGVRWTAKFILGSYQYVSLQDELTIAGLIVFIVLTFVIFELGLFLLNKWRFSLAELERFKKENAEYRFELLRAQLNPHFLFNSLNTLSSLVYENPENAGLFIRELADVYRYILENKEKELVSLDTEIGFVSSFITLMQLRFGENLRVEVDLPTDNHTLFVAPLTLQLLIENAIKHNVVSKKKPLKIDIFLENEYLVVKNNLQPKINKETGTETGLKNITNRYGYLTDRKVIIEDNESEFVVKIPLPNTETVKM